MTESLKRLDGKMTECLDPLIEEMTQWYKQCLKVTRVLFLSSDNVANAYTVYRIRNRKRASTKTGLLKAWTKLMKRRPNA